MLDDTILEKTSERKLRLIAVACCYRILGQLTDQRSVNVLLVADRLLDGNASREELVEAGDDARLAYENAFQLHDRAAYAVTSLALEDPMRAVHRAVAYSALAVGHERAANKALPRESGLQTMTAESETGHQAMLLRHIMGNPFRPHLAPSHLPSTVVQLAAALYNGEDCGFALHDALMEAGQAELAEHFRQEQVHPKGCWVLDLILGKK